MHAGCVRTCVRTQTHTCTLAHTLAGKVYFLSRAPQGGWGRSRQSGIFSNYYFRALLWGERRPFVADDNTLRFSQFLSLHSALISGALDVCSSSTSTLSTVTNKNMVQMKWNIMGTRYWVADTYCTRLSKSSTAKAFQCSFFSCILFCLLNLNKLNYFQFI